MVNAAGRQSKRQENSSPCLLVIRGPAGQIVRDWAIIVVMVSRSSGEEAVSVIT